MTRLIFTLFALALATAVRSEISLVDDTGRTVVLAEPAQRIVALAPHIVENLFSVGAGNQIVGTVSFSDFPEAASSIPQVGTYNAFSLESIVGLNPDLIIAWQSGSDNRAVDRLTALGYPLYVSEPRKLDDIAQALINLGELTGNEQNGKRAADDFMASLQRLRTEFSRQSEVSVFYQIWNEPLQTLNDEHLISDVIRVCGGSNVFADALSLAPKINIESVIARDPQVIVAAGMGGTRPEWLDDWYDWKGLTAVRNNSLFFIHPDLMHRHTARILLGAELMCQYLDQVRSEPHAVPISSSAGAVPKL